MAPSSLSPTFLPIPFPSGTRYIIAAFLYLVLGMTAHQYNTFHFARQVRGLDLRKLDKAQFTQFGRLIDKSFQMPREFQGMTAD